MLQYRGFEVIAEGRQYSFHLSQKDADRDFKVLVANASFKAGLLLYQEAPEVCYRKLSSDLANEETTTPVCVRQQVTQSEVTQYKASSKAKAKVLTEEQRLLARERYKASGRSHF